MEEPDREAAARAASRNEDAAAAREADDKRLRSEEADERLRQFNQLITDFISQEAAKDYPNIQRRVSRHREERVTRKLGRPSIEFVDTKSEVLGWQLHLRTSYDGYDARTTIAEDIFLTIDGIVTGVGDLNTFVNGNNNRGASSFHLVVNYLRSHTQKL